MIVAKRKTSNIYHRMNCRYVENFCEDIFDYYDQEDSALIGLKPCKCCCNEKKYLEEISDKLPKIFEGVTVDIRILDHHIYVNSETSEWKFKYDALKEQYKLYHHPFVTEEEKKVKVETLYFHRQKDVPATMSFIKDVNYIFNHDKAKKIMAIDYRNLPKQTKRQKKYYNQAKRRERKKSTKRVLELFDKIEHEPYMCLV